MMKISSNRICFSPIFELQFITFIMKNYLFALIVAFATTISAQETLTEEQLLKDISEQKLIEDNDKANAYKLAALYNWPITIEHEDGAFSELIGLFSDGTPKYYTTDSWNAAKTISTNKVHRNGGLGLNLEGQNMTIGMWDGGDVLTTHNEVSGRVTDRDGISGVHYHPCHVAGIMISRGAVSSAKGMAPQAKMWAYDWNNDVSEMKSAANSGIIVSNHSYGTIVGWTYTSGRWYWYGNTSVSSTTDYKFGFYSTKAKEFDQTARLYPGYLIVKSAGNDRNQGISTGGHYVQSGTRWVWSTAKRNRDPSYGSVHGTATAKNPMVVASVKDISSGYNGRSSVIMSSYSCWGPTDDGRIKPDISANGESVYSMYDGKSKLYASSSGTSMAAPNASGSALLVQQQHKALKGKFMTAASLKGLIIHTADEAGSYDGPDYIFGWGLMNTAKAVQALSSSDLDIVESNITNRAQKDIRVAAKGNRWVRITLAWTDYEGSPTGAQLNPSKLMLVNDLDVRLIKDGGSTTYLPYTLNPSSPGAAPSKADNFRDNVEQIYVKVPQAGNYTIRVTHKGNLVGGNQNYTLIHEGFEPPTSASFTQSKKDVCIADTVFFTNTTKGSFTGLRWEFQGGHISVSTNANPYVVYNGVGKFNVKLTVYQTPSNAIVTGTVDVHSSPIANIINNKVYCLPNFQFEKIEATNGTGTWNGFSWMRRTDSCVFTPSTVGDGDYPLVFTARNSYGCTAKDSTTVRIKNAPQVTLFVAPGKICKEANPAILSGGSPSGGKYLVDSILQTKFDPSKYTLGKHHVKYEFTDLTTTCSGEDVDQITLDICESIEAFNAAGKVKVYPNPFANTINIEMVDLTFSQAELTDLRGKLLMVMDFSENERHYTLDVSEVPVGLYLLKLIGKDGERSLRLLKE